MDKKHEVLRDPFRLVCFLLSYLSLSLPLFLSLSNSEKFGVFLFVAKTMKPKASKKWSATYKTHTVTTTTAEPQHRNWFTRHGFRRRTLQPLAVLCTKTKKLSLSFSHFHFWCALDTWKKGILRVNQTAKKRKKNRKKERQNKTRKNKSNMQQVKWNNKKTNWQRVFVGNNKKKTKQRK